MKKIKQLLSNYPIHDETYTLTGAELFSIKDQLEKHLSWSINFLNARLYHDIFVWIENNKVCIEY